MTGWRPDRRAPPAPWVGALVLAAAAPPATAGEEATLERPAAHVVMPGRRLPGVVGRPVDRMRLVAWEEGALQAIPFQVDERTAAEEYAFDRGDERRSDTDDGLFDANDELVFMARDAGDRVPPARRDLGQAVAEELELLDPRGGGRAWAYLLVFADEPPPSSPEDYVSFDWNRHGDLQGWSARRVRVRGSPGGNFLHLRELRFRREDGYGADVLDRAKVRLEAGYLFTDIVRHADELRVGVVSWLDGPVRAIARFTIESYLIWGHWVRPPPGKPCRLVVYGNRAELDAGVKLPVDLESDTRSELRVSLDFDPAAGGVRIWTDRNPAGWRGGSHRRKALRALDRSFPRWIAAAFPHGSLLARVHLGEGLRGREEHALFLEDGPAPDPPEDAPGSLANTGVDLDITALKAGTYGLRVALQFAPPVAAGEEERLTRADAPLQCRAVRE